jgi:hypothetical protein
MNKKLANGSGIGLVVGMMVGIVIDLFVPMLGGLPGIAMVLCGAFGIVFGAGVATMSGHDSKERD